MLLQSVLHLRARERPHVIVDPSSGDLTHLITGAADPCPPGVNCSAGCREWNASPWNINGKTVVRWTLDWRMGRRNKLLLKVAARVCRLHSATRLAAARI